MRVGLAKRAATIASAVALNALALGCDDPNPGATPVPRTVATESTRDRGDARTWLRPCGTGIGVSDELPEAEDSLTVGPVFFGGFNHAAELSEEQVTPDAKGNVEPQKYPTAVDTSGGETVWLVVDEDDRGVFALNYDNDDWAFRVGDGQHTVGFLPCDHADVVTYNGGFLAAAPGCATLRVHLGTPTSEPVATVHVPFAVPSCDSG